MSSSDSSLARPFEFDDMAWTTTTTATHDHEIDDDDDDDDDDDYKLPNEILHFHHGDAEDDDTVEWEGARSGRRLSYPLETGHRQTGGRRGSRDSMAAKGGRPYSRGSQRSILTKRSSGEGREGKGRGRSLSRTLRSLRIPSQPETGDESDSSMLRSAPATLTMTLRTKVSSTASMAEEQEETGEQELRPDEIFSEYDSCLDVLQAPPEEVYRTLTTGVAEPASYCHAAPHGQDLYGWEAELDRRVEEEGFVPPTPRPRSGHHHRHQSRSAGGGSSDRSGSRGDKKHKNDLLHRVFTGGR